MRKLGKNYLFPAVAEPLYVDKIFLKFIYKPIIHVKLGSLLKLGILALLQGTTKVSCQLISTEFVWIKAEFVSIDYILDLV